MAKNKSWFRMEKKADVAEIEIFDEIDSFWGIGPREFKERFDEVKDSASIRLLLNSPGGSVFDGMAIYNIIASERSKVSVEVVGLAASIASIIALAGSKLSIAKGAYLMIHDPYTLTVGGANDLRKTADLLDSMKGEFVSIYSARSGLDEKEVADLMADETWMTSEMAMEKGFADAEIDYGDMAAKATAFPLAKYGFAHVPQMLAGPNERNKIDTPRALESLLRDAGFGKKDAVAIVANGWKALDLGEPESGEQGEPAISEPIAESPENIKIRMAALLAERGIAV